MSAIKVMLASDVAEDKLRFPLVAMPKIDGVRAVNFTGSISGRSLKKFGNKFVNNVLSRPELVGLDGELTVGPPDNITHPDLCRLTTSALSRHEGEPELTYNVFDAAFFGNVHVNDMPYKFRYGRLFDIINELKAADYFIGNGIHFNVVKAELVSNLEQLLELENTWLDMGFEGVIVRDPEGFYKHGRSTVREMGLLRIKRFIEEDAIVEELEEGMENTNEQTKDERGYATRSSAKAGKIPNGMVGVLHCKDVKTGVKIEVSPGKMSHADRVKFWEQPELIIDKVIKYKHFPRGVKDKPRFPTFQSFRDPVDMVWQGSTV